ncbi:flagellar brake protein [Pseudomonas sp. gcc21]|uniref:flagellar brake protein n=1 Tax=Pseudomonas sp. gcc21 TaxID=2726989 RepID=UPI00145233EC|nr:flagellar brake protein [Pseudomonas sp. gcc21]QJD59877.1 flagellar brake protein [Pseudomonas sp. gcc21]
MPLIPVKEDEVVLGVPLPWNLLDVEGRVIFEQSRVLDSQPLLNQLFKLGLYRSAPEPAAAEERIDVAGNGTQGDVQNSSLEHIQLAPGDPVQLQTMHPTHAERYQVRMIGVHAPVSIMVTTPTHQGKLAFIKEGQQFLVRGFVGKDAVAYRTRVLKSNLAPFPYLHLAYPQSVQSMRIRSSARVPLQLVTAVLTEQGPKSAKIVDLSVGGARMASDSLIAHKGDDLKLSFRVNPAGMEVYMTVNAKVRAVQTEQTGAGPVITGVEFVELGEQERLYLTTVVYQNLLKDTL